MKKKEIFFLISLEWKYELFRVSNKFILMIWEIERIFGIKPYGGELFSAIQIAMQHTRNL